MSTTLSSGRTALVAMAVAVGAIVVADRASRDFVVGTIALERTAPPGVPLRDFTGGRDLLPFFDAVDATLDPRDFHVVLLGDSTVQVPELADSESLPSRLEAELQARGSAMLAAGDAVAPQQPSDAAAEPAARPARGQGGVGSPSRDVAAELRRRLAGGGRVRVIDASLLGLNATDAWVLSRAMRGIRPDVLVYSLNPRAFRRDGSGEDVESRIPGVLAGRLGPTEVPRASVWAATGAEQLATSFVRARLALLRNARFVRQWLCRRVAERSPWPALAGRCGGRPRRTGGVGDPMALAAVAAASSARADAAHDTAAAPETPAPGWFYRAADYDFAGSNAASFLELLGDCERAGDCLLYRTPLRTTCSLGFEPALLDAWRSWLRGATAGRVAVLDLEAALGPEYFRPFTSFGTCDPIHLNAAGVARVATSLAEAIASGG